MADSSENPPARNVDDLKSADAREVHRAVREEGEAELRRPAQSLFWSGVAAGIAINTSLIAEAALHMALPDRPWRILITSLGYPIGFMVVILGRMQLFTESTVTAMLPLVTRPSWQALGGTLRLWGIVLLANLIGTALAGGATAWGLVGSEAFRAAAVEVANKITEHGPGGTFLNAIPAGFMIAMVAWVLPNAREQSVLVIAAFTYVIGIAGFSHSIVGSDETFLLLFAGRIDAAAALGSIGPAVLGNLVGGAGLFALLAHGQVRGEMPKALTEDNP